jgi:hypothetical protein
VPTDAQAAVKSTAVSTRSRIGAPFDDGSAAVDLLTN